MTNQNESFNLDVIGQIGMTVTDVDRSIAFYRDKLGLRFLFKAPPGLGFFDCNGIRLLLDAAAENPEKHYSSIIYFKVADIHAAVTALSGQGVDFEQKPSLIAEMPDHNLWMAFFRDPDANLLALMCELPK